MNKPIEELIQRLKEPDYQFYGYELSKSEADLVISALEKQIPKKIEDWNSQASCPNCKALFFPLVDIKYIIGFEMPHCKHCGQKLDWSVEDE